MVKFYKNEDEFKKEVEGLKKELSLEEIVTADVKRNYPDITPEQGIKHVQDMMNAGAKIVQFFNSLFVIVGGGNRVIKFHTITADNERTYVTAAVMFFGYMKRRGATKLVTYFDNPAQVKKLKSVFPPAQAKWISVQPSEDPSKGKFRLEVDLNGLA